MCMVMIPMDLAPRCTEYRILEQTFGRSCDLAFCWLFDANGKPGLWDSLISVAVWWVTVGMWDEKVLKLVM